MSNKGTWGIVLTVLAIMAALAWTSTSAAQSRSREERPSQRQNASTNKFGLSKPLPRTPNALRIATYNTLNLFDHVDDPSLQGEFDDIKTPTADDRCKGLAAAIIAVDADIIALQEVESLEALRWFRDTYLPKAGYKWLASKDVGYYRGVECSLMSRYEITDIRIWPDESLDDVSRRGLGWSSVPAKEQHGLKFQRSPLMVDVKISDDYSLTIFSLHHKAGPDFKYHREAEALQIIEYLDELRAKNPSRNIVVMGDFNAAPFDKSLRTYLEAGMIDTLAHRTIWREDAEAPAFKTHESDKVLDYILLSGAAYREFIPGSAFVFGTLYPGDQYDYRKDPHPPGYASDHYPVVVDLRMKDVN